MPIEIRVTVSPDGKISPVTLATGASYRVIFERPHPFRLRLTGMLFDTAKCFLLPGAVQGMKRLAALYEEHQGFSLLVTGHTDRVGSVKDNDTLALERARTVAAFLTDDIDAWASMYDEGVPSSKRWGDAEDHHMLATIEGNFLPGGMSLASGLRSYQEARGLVIDGIAGPATRDVLIGDYMGVDGTTLPADAELQVHGCGEHFPALETPDEVAEPENRRVEVFFFPGPVEPPPRRKSQMRSPPNTWSGSRARPRPSMFPPMVPSKPKRSG